VSYRTLRLKDQQLYTEKIMDAVEWNHPISKFSS